MSQKQNKRKRHVTTTNQHKSVATTSETLEMFAGPLPHPSTLEGYKAVDPKLVDTIIQMAVDQQLHRHQMEKREQKIIPFIHIFGQLLGTFIGLIALIGGFYLLTQNKTIEGYSTLVGTVGTLVGVYLYNKKMDSKTNQEELK